MRKFIAILFCSALSLTALSQTPNDTLYLYCSWEAVFDERPDTIIINPIISANDPTRFDFETNGNDRKRVKNLIKNDVVALSVGGNYWFANGYRIKNLFSGDNKRFSHFVPLYFNAKAIIVQFNRENNFGESLLNSLFGYDPNSVEMDEYGFIEGDIPPFYWVDVENNSISKIDHKLLSSLLLRYDYYDLLRRYESMRDYKMNYIIADYTLNLINRMAEDPAVPFLAPVNALEDTASEN